MVDIASFLQDWILTIDAANKGIRILSIEFRLVNVSKWKQDTMVLANFSFAGSKMHGYGVKSSIVTDLPKHATILRAI